MRIRPSSIAGTWYPGEPETLSKTITHFLAESKPFVPDGRIWGLLVPHAGYRYSGQIAAHAFQSIRGLQPELVVVLSPYHQPHPAPLLTTAYEAYETPLGVIPVDQPVLGRLNRALELGLNCGLTPLEHEREHAVEIELPFLQVILEEFRLLPLMLRDQRPALVKVVGQALGETLSGRSVLIIASSDLSHFYPQTAAEKYDAAILSRLAAFDVEGVLHAEEEGVGFACGHGAIAAMLLAARRLGANKVQLLPRATSGAVTGDYDSVVGYGAALVWQGRTPINGRNFRE